MSEPLPTALILPTPGADAAATVAAVQGQTAGPPSVLLVTDGGPADAPAPASPLTFADAAGALRAAAGLAPWVWLLDSGIIPEPTALEELLTARARMPSEPRPGLLASQVTGRDGAPDPASIPALDAGRPNRVVLALGQRAIALRAARYGSLLVHAPSALAAGAPSGRGDLTHDLAWTARLLTERAGLLVPASRVCRRTGRRPHRWLARPADLVGAAQLLRTISANDRLWFLSRLIGGPPRD